MAKGKVRSPEEIKEMQRDIRRQHRPLLRQIEMLDIREKTLAWVMGEDDPFAAVEAAEADAEDNEQLIALAEASE